MTEGMAQRARTPDAPLLTIAIPTYNRTDYLDLCLAHVCSQLPGDGSVEILVSNNASTDTTDAVVRKYLAEGYPIRSVVNERNIGPDGNFLQCFRMAAGKYFLNFGDDDILLEGALARVLTVLRGGEYGVVFLNSYGFVQNFEAERPAGAVPGYKVYDDILTFLTQVSYFLTFTSANVVNRSLVDPSLDMQPFLDTNLVQLGWTFSALFAAQKNAYISDYVVAARLYNSGGYALCQVFGHNFNKTFEIFVRRGIDPRYFEAINERLLTTYFPAQITRLRNNLIRLKPENYFRSLYPLFRGYPRFWVFTVPAIYLPARVAYFFFWLAGSIRKLRLRIRSRRAYCPRPSGYRDKR